MAPAGYAVSGASRNYGYPYDHYTVGTFDVTAYSVADAKNRLPSLINKALAGEEMVITRPASQSSSSGLPQAEQPEPPELTSGSAPEREPGRASG